MLVSFLIQFHVTCPACRSGVAVNGVSGAVTCSVCGRTTELTDDFWSKRFAPDIFEPFLLKEGKTEDSNVVGVERLECRLTYGKQMPLCGQCHAPFELSAVTDGAQAGTVTCAKCARVARVRTADARSKLIDRHAVLLVDETVRVVEKVKQPVAFPCMKCGGTLSVDGTRRTIECSYCNSPNYLPDGVWQVIYPVETVQPFYVVCEYSDDEARAARWADLDERTQDAARPDLTPALYGQLSHDKDRDVRAAIAGNPVVPIEMLARLADDDDDDVLVALVKNRAVDEAILIAIARKDRYEVMGALAAEPQLPASVVEVMAGVHRWESRKHAAQHPNLPLPILRKLASDSNDDVKRAAKARIQELEKQGVEVPGGGLLSRLFGD